MILFGTRHTAASHRHREHCKLVALAFEPGNLSKRWRREARAAIVLRELLFTSIYTYWLAGLPNRGGGGRGGGGDSRAYGRHISALQGLKTHVSSN